MKKLKRALLLALLAATVPATAVGQEKSETPKIEVDAGVSFDKPDGWVEKKGSKGVVVRLEAAGDSKSHIEFRVAPDVDDKKVETFFTSFHASLQSAGLKKVVTTTSKTYGKNVGEETQYEMKNKAGATFRLIIWQVHSGNKGWMIVGFFHDDERETLYRDYGTLIEGVVFSK